jgi:hypothetical protein
MIATRKPRSRQQSAQAWHDAFMAMLPAIERTARVAFRRLDPEARADAVQAVVAYAITADVRLVELGRADVAYPTPLATFGIRQFRDGAGWRRENHQQVFGGPIRPLSGQGGFGQMVRGSSPPASVS